MADLHFLPTYTNHASLFWARLAALELAIKAWFAAAGTSDLGEAKHRDGLSNACAHLRHLAIDLYSPLDAAEWLDSDVIHEQLRAVEGALFLVNRVVSPIVWGKTPRGARSFEREQLLALFAQVESGVSRLRLLTERFSSGAA